MRQFAKTICIVLSCYMIGISVYAQESPPIDNKDFLKLKTQIETHYFSFDEDGVQSLLNQAFDLIEQYPDSWYPRYYAGLISIQLGNIYRADNRKVAYHYYKEALNHMHLAYERSPIAETTVVLADVFGKLASLRTVKIFYYGHQSKKYLIEAFRMSEHSPKNHLLAGIEMMWTPAIFGGSKKRARKFLNKALASEASWRETDRLIVRWATRPEIFAHLAQLEILCEKPDQAQYFATQALQHIPDYGFVMRDIIPQLY